MDDETSDGFTTPSLHGSPAMPEQVPAPPSRRRFLIGGGVLVAAAAGGGVALGMTASSRHTPQSLPLVAHVAKELTAAVAAERALVASVDAAMAHAHGPAKRVLRAIRNDHVEHLAALSAAVRDDAFPAPVPKSSSSSAPVTGPIRQADIRAVERRASRAAAARAMQLSGRDAALLASIAASEATHAELLK
jgi:hypothetical protein